MRLLLDTHTVIWHIEQSPSLSTKASIAIKNPDNEIFVSAVSIWELSIKVSLGKLKLPKAIREITAELRDSGVTFIQISDEHAMATETLPWHHRDPFDRMLVAQAQLEGLTIVTADPLVQQYGVPDVW